MLLHEGGHAFTHFSGRRGELAAKFGLDEGDLVTHYFDYDRKDVGGLYQHIDFTKLNYYEVARQLLIQLVRVLLGRLDTPEPVPEQPRRNRMVAWAKAIEEFEDYVIPGGRYRDGTPAPRGSLSFRHQNPGNLRWSPFEIDNRNNFSVFATYEDGFNALLHQLQIAVEGTSRVYRPEMTLLEFFRPYAPRSANNHPETYAKYVAKQLGVPITTQIKTLA